MLIIHMKTTKFFVSIFTGLALLTSCSEVPPPEVKLSLVEVYKVPSKEVNNLQKFPAIVNASDLTELSFRIEGEIKKFPINSGQQVKKGDLIASLDPTNFELTVRDKKAKLDLSKTTMGRAKKMVDLGNISESTYDELEAHYRIALAEYEFARLNLQYVELRAPFDGIIASIDADNYQNTRQGQLVATMHRVDKIEIQVELPDIIVAAAENKIENRSNILLNVSLDAYPDHIFKATYKEHTTEQSEQNKSYLLILEMPVDEERLALQGMPGSVEIDLNKLRVKKVNINEVPVESVTYPDNVDLNQHQSVVWRVNDDSTVQSVLVETQGVSSFAMMKVSGDLNEGDLIVSKGHQYLEEGVIVNIKQQGDKQ